MKYLMLIYHGTTATPGTPAWEEMSAEEQGRIYAEWQALTDVPGVTPGVRMEAPETATTVRVADGETLTTDGPFAETKEALAGYCLFEGDDLDAAIALAARIPSARLGGAIEVRPLAG